MIFLVKTWFFGALLLAPFPLSADEAANSSVSFSKEIAPILAAKCLTCHNTEKAKGSYDLQTLGGLFAAGKGKKTPIVPNDPDQSELFLRLITADPDERMPQKDEPLSAGQIEAIKRWIKEGASVGGKDKTTSLSSLIPVIHPAPPRHYRAAVPALAVQFANGGNNIITGGYHEILVWDLAGKLLNRITNVAQSTASIRAINTNGGFAVAGGTPGKLGELRLVSSLETNQAAQAVFQHHEMLLGLAVNLEGTLLAAGGSDNAIRIYDLVQHQQTHLIQQHSDWVTSLSFSPDGKHLLSGSRDRTARVYSTATGALEAAYAEHKSAVLAVVYRPDNQHAYSAGKDKSIHLWRVEDGKKIREIGSGNAEIYTLHAVDKQIFSAGADKVVRQYDSNSANLIQTFAGPRDWIYGLGFSPEKQLIAAGTYDGFVFLWNFTNATPVINFKAAP